MLAEYSDLGAGDSPALRDLTPAEIGELRPGTRESILLTGMVLACVDEDYTAFKRDAIERLREQFSISRGRSATLENRAKAFVIDQRFDEFYADGIIDAGEQQRIEQITRRLEISLAALHEIESRAPAAGAVSRRLKILIAGDRKLKAPFCVRYETLGRGEARSESDLGLGSETPLAT